MLITGVKSRPKYVPLKPDLSGRVHVLIGQGDGGAALLRLLGDMPSGAEIIVIYTGESLTQSDQSRQIAECGLSNLTLLPTQAAALEALDTALAGCAMGTRLYVAGSESFIGSVEQVAIRYNLNSDEVQREHQGSRARRVFCVHCKTSNENVRTNIVCCQGCGRHLVVRDHYSRRLAGYMGAMVDAEFPGRLPEIREAFA